MVRRDQRTVLLRSTGCRSALSPSRPHPFHFANRALVTSEHPRYAATAAGFRLRSGCGRCAAATFRYALLCALRSTFPAPGPQTEADGLILLAPDDVPPPGASELHARD
jgi:hypothetical protein